MADLQGIAQQIRDLIHAQAPASVDEIVKGLPDEAVVAAGPVALIIVLVLFFMIVGALTGGKKKKSKRAEIEEVDDDDIPAPITPRATPPRPPAPVREPEAKLDKRGEAVLEAVRKARAPEADFPSEEQKLAQAQAASRVARENAGALKLLAAGDLDAGFDKMAEEAQALQAAGKIPKAAAVWREIAILSEGVDNRRALVAAEGGFILDKSDFWGNVFLARLRVMADLKGEVFLAAQAAQAAAKTLREKAVALAEIGDAETRIGKYEEARTSYIGAVEMMRTLARGGEKRAQHDLSVCLNKLGDLHIVFREPDKARELFEEDLTIARHLAKAHPDSIEYGRDVLISLVKLADLINSRPMFTEALALAESLKQKGHLPGADAWMIDAIRKALAAAPAS
jgi:tetratricopeptide (TPR) repeat protein